MRGLSLRGAACVCAAVVGPAQAASLLLPALEPPERYLEGLRVQTSPFWGLHTARVNI